MKGDTKMSNYRQQNVVQSLKRMAEAYEYEGQVLRRLAQTVEEADPEYLDGLGPRVTDAVMTAMNTSAIVSPARAAIDAAYAIDILH